MTGWRRWAVAGVVALWGMAGGWVVGPGMPRAWAALADQAGVMSYRAFFLGAEGAGGAGTGGLVPVVRQAPRPLSRAEAARRAFQVLCDGPPPGLRSTVRPGCRVIRAWFAGDTLHLEFTPGFDWVPGVPAANAFDAQMELTAAQFGVRKLQFWVGGQSLGGPGMPMPVDGRPGH